MPEFLLILFVAMSKFRAVIPVSKLIVSLVILSKVTSLKKKESPVPCFS